MIAMTRTNIKYLRALLSQHEEDPFPEQMDDVVRAAATERAKQIRRQRIPAKRAAKSPLWLDSLSSASLAVVLTLCSSLLLYHTLTDEPPKPLFEHGGCDLMIVMGTALAVFPFNSIVHDAEKTCPRVLINLENLEHNHFDFDNLLEHPERLLLKGRAQDTIK